MQREGPIESLSMGLSERDPSEGMRRKFAHGFAHCVLAVSFGLYTRGLASDQQTEKTSGPRV